ncbi:SusC/RagA family TonB-linked outer membrane protein [Mucilaginibacter sp. HMF5004]|uniref:SusC/RagA family TonB-linked outer membrane protein n=1 Tax=Mucilaginibacter rivuli TaxID=2857527 RepID=UPI001C5F6ECE|nr:SusC/RagA family TonB-linked outer membrane protein [Mucilaginibacter rivuli]MBW4888535.1 SusC/RagA family TonB-linked outer membrane protein [Mucilaginibacter rivuli]
MIYIVTKVVKRIALPVLIMGLTTINLQAQQADTAKLAPNIAIKRGTTVTGTIKDAQTGKPVAGVNIKVAEYDAAITDEKGQFSISVPNLDALLIVSSPGYQNKEIALKGRKSVSANIYGDTFNSIYGAVEMPYASKSKLHTVNSVSSVDVADGWQRSVVEGSDTYLQGRMAGLNVTRRSGTPGIGGNMLVNGFTSLYATNQPLIVVDGMIYDNTSYGNSLMTGHVGNPLSNIDIKDIVSYTLIKDGASMYGTKGANGVLLITTSRAKSQATTIDFAAYGGYNNKVSNQPVMKSNDFKVYLSDLLKTVPGQTDATIKAKPYLNDNPNPDYYRYHNETNWQDQVMSNSYDQNYYLKITGGDNIATYGLSVGYLKEEGITNKTDLQRYQTRFNADLNLSKNFTSTVRLAFVNTQQNIANQAIAPKTNPLYLALIKAPFMDPHDIGVTGAQSPNYAGYDSLNISNPSALLNKYQGINKNYRFSGSVNFKYVISRKLTAQTLLGVTYDKIRENQFIPALGVVPDTLAQAVTTNESATNTQRLYSLYTDTRVSYQTFIGNNQKLSANVGLRYNTNDREVDFGRGYNSATDDYVSVTGGLPALRVAGGENGKWNWMNVYANADYEFKNRYFASFNIASDGSSRFGTTANAPLTINSNKFSVMPSLAIGWLVSSEKFMAKVKFIDALKLRASYGLVGNDDIGNYSAKQYYVSQNFLGSQGLVRGNVANSSLRWESITKANAGLDASLFNERLNISFDYFNNKSNSMITYDPIASITGFQYALTNNSAMSTNGISLGVAGRLLNKKVIWDLGINISTYKNKVTSIPGNVMLTSYAGGTLISQVGQAANLFYGFKTAGVYSSDAEATASGLKNRREDGSVTAFRGGDVRFVDTNNDGFIDNTDRQVIGNPNPTITGGINTTLAYKRWSMDALFTYSLGNDIYNYTRRQLSAESGYQNQLLKVNNRWRAQGQITDVPRAEYGDPAGNSRFSDRWIESGSYLRLRTMSVSYNVPVKAGIGIKSAKVYLTGNNLFTLTNYLGYDPEFSAAGNIFSQGTDIGLEPQFRTVQIGIRVGL